MNAVTASIPTKASGPQHHTWVVVDTVDPMTAWELKVPKPAFDDAAAELAKAGEESQLFVRANATGDDATLPDFESLEESDGIFLGLVAIGTSGTSVTEHLCSDLGQRLSDAEPNIDATYRRRFAASRPPIGIFADDDDSTLVVCTWSDIFFERSDAFAHEAAADRANQKRLHQLLDAANAIAAKYGGEFKRR